MFAHFVDQRRSVTRMSAVMLLTFELAMLYLLGSYAMSRLAALDSAEGWPRTLFYVFVMPGVTLHETAHWIGCKITGSPVKNFVPFFPQKDEKTGSIRLGYVEHGSRGVLADALVGIFPMIINPIGVVLLTAWMSPMTLGEILRPEDGAMGLVAGLANFATQSPMMFILWLPFAFSFSLGSVLSNEDLVAVPAASAVLIVIAVGFSMLSDANLVEALEPVAKASNSVYLLPVAVAGIAALASVYVHRHASRLINAQAASRPAATEKPKKKSGSSSRSAKNNPWAS